MQDGIETFVVIHDQRLLLDYEQQGRYANLTRCRYLFVGEGETELLRDRSDIIVARCLPDNIEHYPHLLSFTAWYAIARNRLATTTRVAIVEYDVTVMPEFESETERALQERPSIVGYVPFPLTHPMYLHATPWLIESLSTTYGLDAMAMVREHLAIGGEDLWPCTSNAAMRAAHLAEFVDWYLPLTTKFRYDQMGAPVHERAIWVFCKVRQPESMYVPDVLVHDQSRSHGIVALSREDARKRADSFPPLIAPARS